MINKKIGICDGSCLKNPGPGGWAFGIFDDDPGKFNIEYGCDPLTTNNIMELTALIKVLQQDQASIIYTDSNYVIEGVTKWRFGWAKNGWINSEKKPVKNLELWKTINSFTNLGSKQMFWIKGHANLKEVSQENALLYRAQHKVDEFARMAAESQTTGTLSVFL